MDPLISIIVPVYNTGDILKQTVNSLLSQEYKMIEIILVDDGSDKVTHLICDECGDLDERVKVFHRENGGICDARNFGLSIASGEFITFSDHDDCVDPRIYRIELDLIKQYNADIAIVGKKTYFNNKVEYKGKKFVYTEVDIPKNIFDLISSRAIENVWNILYKKSVLEGVFFDTELKRGQEDINFNLAILEKCNKIASVELPLYIHIVRNSMSVSSGLHLELIEAFLKTNNNVYNVVTKCCTNFIGKEYEYMNMQGERIKFCLAYAVKMGISYSEFTVLANKLKVYRIPYNTKMIKSINTFVYSLAIKRRWKSLFLILQCYEFFAKNVYIFKLKYLLNRGIKHE